jgi:prepilin-type N-terminal cleavage/methylation domain-containing protein
MKNRRPAFTLIEVLVVMAILAVVLALVLVGVQKARESASRLECASEMKTLGQALHGYHDMHGAFPGQANVHENCWMYKILPFIEQQALYIQGNSFDPLTYSATWYMVVPAFLCPADPRDYSGGVYWFNGFGYAMTNYLGVAGSDSSMSLLNIYDGILGDPNNAVRINQITDGLSNTVMVGERPPCPDSFWGWWAYRWYDNNLWAIGDVNWSPYTDSSGINKVGIPCPDKAFFSSGNLTDYCHTNHYWSFHTGGGNWLLADGAVRFLTYDAGEEIIPTMATKDGGEAIPAFD